MFLRLQVNQSCHVVFAGQHEGDGSRLLLLQEAARTASYRTRGTFASGDKALNAALKAKGKPPVRIRTVPNVLEDEDVPEMADAGLLMIVIVDDIHASFWKQILLVMQEAEEKAAAKRPNPAN